MIINADPSHLVLMVLSFAAAEPAYDYVPRTYCEAFQHHHKVTEEMQVSTPDKGMQIVTGIECRRIPTRPM
ncbi:MAG: hypothetical protein ABL907_22235 [Hyphomicrobium sp.]